MGSHYNAQKFTARRIAPLSDEDNALFNQFMTNLTELSRRNEPAYKAYSKRLNNEPWQVIGPELVDELQRLDALEDADQQTAMRMGY
jgi:hypothetical protein